mmetsp:Transcript_40024/g.58879  ORF Transcript_40024/g.58879 Transcript_40024/m.58879 type:complete len:277 (-) Transcript_40024:179-1009(-)|eukprot:CAMPEP_0195526274 /NCGR_PEP_ID=MMETSP0794_2-20130614/27242_1 /TAXON_ID=515487 /ORGANISM="Stephanopyxis turris, Strain CCMP 815" /LENGTH=276 /DNA_ID=CAMNT_0040656919 /DNA_START=67 /DNA_END=897 /DNA_ORIENTATION=-
MLSVRVVSPFMMMIAITIALLSVTPKCKALRMSMSSDSSSAVKSNNPNQQLQIAFVTGNEMKSREMQLILEEHGATAAKNEVSPPLVNIRLLKVDLPEIQEVSTEAVAKEKAMLGAQLAGGACVVEDTSLQFTALGGMPGPYIKWFQQKLGSLGLYKILFAYEDKSATAVCTLAFCPAPHADPVLFTGETKGKIVAPVEGSGFGWDSIFVPEDGENDTPFSMMKTEEKNGLSHRGKAVRQWADWLGKNQEELWRRQRGEVAIGHKGLDFKTESPEQ